MWWYSRSSQGILVCLARGLFEPTTNVHPLDVASSVGRIFSPTASFHRLACSRMVFRNSARPSSLSRPICVPVQAHEGSAT